MYSTCTYNNYLCIHRYNTHTYMNLNLILYTLGVQQNIVRDEFNPGIPNNMTASSSCINRRVFCKQKLEVQFFGLCLVQNKYYNKIKNNYWVTIKVIYKWMLIHLMLHKECTRLKKNSKESTTLFLYNWKMQFMLPGFHIYQSISLAIIFSLLS